MSGLPPCPKTDELRQLSVGRLPVGQAHELEDHLDYCQACAERLDALEAAGTPSSDALRRASSGQPGTTRVSSVVAASVSQRHNTPIPNTEKSVDLSSSDRELYDFLAPPQRPDELGRLGPYRVLRVLGAGGMGVVFKAEDMNLERPVALKVMRPTLACSDSARKRFVREAQATASLQDDHIVSIYAVGEDRGLPYLAMQFLLGESLESRLEREGTLSVPEVLRIGREVALGLRAAHARGLVHRDIKPANIWLETSATEEPRATQVPATGPGPSLSICLALGSSVARVKILDFGLARARTDARLTQPGCIAGTPAYMAPEQARGEEVDARCDLFSLGCVLYHLCTGEQPFQGVDVMALLLSLTQDEPVPPRQRNPLVPSGLSDLILKLLAKRPEERPQSPAEVLLALRQIEDKAHAPTFLETPSVRPRRRRLWISIVAAVLVGLLGSVGLHFASSFPTDEAPPGTIAQKIEGNSTKAAQLPVKAVPVVSTPDVPAPAVSPAKVAAVSTAKVAVPVAPPPNPERPAVEMLSTKLHPLELLNRDTIPIEALMAAGGGDAKKAPGGLVAIWGKSLGMPARSSTSVAFSPDGKTIAWGFHDGRVEIHALAVSATKRVSFLAHEGPVQYVVFSPDGNRFATASSADGIVQVWDYPSPKKRHTYPAHPGAYRHLEFSPDSQLLALGTLGGKGTGHLELYRVYGGFRKPFSQTQFSVSSVAISADGKYLAAGDGDSAGVKVWDLNSGKVYGDMIAFSKPQAALAFGPQSKLLAGSSHYHNTIRLWNVNKGSQIRLLEPDVKEHDKRLRHQVVFAPNGRVLGALTGDGLLRLWDLQENKVRRTFGLGPAVRAVNQFAFSPDGRYVATANNDGTLYIFRLGPKKMKQ